MTTAAHPIPADLLPQHVLIVGKEDNFLYAAPSFPKAVHFVNEYTSGMWEGFEPDREQTGRLTSADLDFFDGLGHPLTLLRDTAGNPRRLEVTDPEVTAEAEIRRRIRAIYSGGMQRYAQLSQKYPDLDPPTGATEPPADDVAFAEFVSAVLTDPKVQFEEGRNCCWWARIWGWCG